MYESLYQAQEFPNTFSRSKGTAGKCKVAQNGPNPGIMVGSLYVLEALQKAQDYGGFGLPPALWCTEDAQQVSMV